MSKAKGDKKPSKSLDELAQQIAEAKAILTVAGAGISVSAGIPDFRSPGTGLYYTLQKYCLPFYTAIFEIEYFKRRPRPFFSLQKDLFPSKNYLPTFTHAFVAYLERSGKLALHVTQNIDGLEHYAGIKKTVLAHGSFSLPALCCKCKRYYSTLTVKAAAFDEAIPVCVCGGIIKPYIVFFGEPVKIDEYQIIDACASDMCLVLGTSLNVGPVNSIPQLCSGKKTLINREAAGEYVQWDYQILGDCDETLRKVSYLMGCQEEVEQLLTDQRKAVCEMDDCFLKDEPHDLALVGFAGELVVPSAVYTTVDGTRIMLALSSQTYIDRLIECEVDVFEINVPKSEIPDEFLKFWGYGSIKCYSKGPVSDAYYKPIDGHFSSYVYKFLEYSISEESENDIWDVISRQAASKVGDKLIMRKRESQDTSIPTDAIYFIKVADENVEEYELQRLLHKKIRCVGTYVEKNEASVLLAEFGIVMNVTLQDNMTLPQLAARAKLLHNYLHDGISKGLKTHVVSIECTPAGQYLIFELKVCHSDVKYYDGRTVMKMIESILRKAFPEIDNIQLRK